jgi:hypothetical protein
VLNVEHHIVAICQQQHWSSHKLICQQLSLLPPEMLISTTPLFLTEMNKSERSNWAIENGIININRSHGAQGPSLINAILREDIYLFADQDAKWCKKMISTMSVVQLLLHPSNGDEGNRDKAIQLLLEMIDKIPSGMEIHRWTCFMYITLSQCYGK